MSVGLIFLVKLLVLRYFEKERTLSEIKEILVNEIKTLDDTCILLNNH